MHFGRTLLAGLGWAGTLGAMALCVLIFQCAYLAFDENRPGVQLRSEGAVRLSSVPDAEIPRVRLARPPSTPRGEVDAVGPSAGQATGGAAGAAADSLIPPPGR
jgi:hypothetical protein